MGFQVDTSGTLEVNLEAYWKLEEASGTRIDFKNSHDLTDNNTVTQAAGIVANAAQFTVANTEFLSEVDTAGLSGADKDFSIAGWFFLDSKTTLRIILSKGDWNLGVEREYIIFYNSTIDRIQFQPSPDGVGSPVVSTANSFGIPPLSTWIFFVAWHDSVANTINIQINNGAIDSVAYSAGVFNGTKNFTIGSRDAAGAFSWDGRLDEIGFWNKILSAQERTDLYNGGSGNTLQAPAILQTITTDTSIFGATIQTLGSDITILTGIFSQIITSDSEILPAPIIQTIDSDTAIQAETTQTIDSDTGISATITQGIASNTSIVSEVAQTLISDTNIIVNAAELKLFKEADLATEVGTEANPVDFLSVEAGLSVQSPDNSFVLFNDKGGTLQSVDAKEIVLSALELNLVDELVGTSTGGLSQTFPVAFPPVDVLDDLIVKVNNVAWTSLDTFVGAGPTDEVYTFDFTTGIVTFGDGTQGKIPPTGNTITISYTPNTILHGIEVSEQLWLGVQSNGIIANSITVDRERATPADVNTVSTLRTPIVSVTGVFTNDDPNRLGTNFFTSGSFDAQSGTITLGTPLPNTNDVLIDYTYQIEDDAEAAFTQIGRTTKSATLNNIPSNNGKKLNFRIVVPTLASPSSPQKIRFKLRVSYKQ